MKNQTFAIDGGQTKTITTRLTRENAASLRRLKKVRVQIITKAQDETGNTRTTTTSKRILSKHEVDLTRTRVVRCRLPRRV